jgi:tRNA(Phe) wybutosine-synthesizing methylase Tyw3
MTPYEEIDENIITLVNSLNSFEAIKTIGSCGGHEDPTEGQWENGTWYVKFELEESLEGWRTVEFLA